MAHDEFGLRSRLVFSEQTRLGGRVIGKAKSTSKQIKNCVPYFEDVDPTLGNRLLNENHFLELDHTVVGLKGFTLSEDGIDDDDDDAGAGNDNGNGNAATNLNDNATGALQQRATTTSSTTNTIRKNLEKLVLYLNQNPQIFHVNNNATHTETETETETNQQGASHNYDVSSIVPRVMVRVNNLEIKIPLDLYYHEIYQTFRFDDAKCCNKDSASSFPAHDESVLHYRNFGTEMKPTRQKKLGFEEMSADRMANEIFGHLQVNDKIAVTGRNIDKDYNSNTTAFYRLFQSLQQKNLTVRISPGSKNAMQDFCFLKNAKKELVGVAKSTFVQMASILGGPSIKTTRLYSYSPYSSESKPIVDWAKRLDFQNPELGTRIQYEPYYYNDSEA